MFKKKQTQNGEFHLVQPVIFWPSKMSKILYSRIKGDAVDISKLMNIL